MVAAGFGEQPLYNLTVALQRDGATLSDRTHRIGFRTVDVQLERDEEGTSFRFVVNGEPVWIRGANWIPDDAFVTRVTRDRLAHRLDQAEFANMNLLRIWGGGYYESDDFYDLCDERGILVWQDFLFACASYAEEEPLWSEVEAEARDNITRIMPHASLALWNGNNENIWGYEEWGWAKRLQGRTWGLGYYLDLLPRLVSELDPARSYTPASPWSGDPDIFANDVDHGSVHLWELWNRVDYPAYRDIHARFVAEFGWQGPATWSTINRAISDSPLTPESPGMFHHQKATDGNDKLTDGLVAHLPLPDDTEDWHWAMSLNQALAVTVAIEHMRSESPRCMGSVVWQLNDCWPVTSWAAVDGYGRAKPLLYALKHVYTDRLLTIQPRDGGLAAIAVNDSPAPWTGTATARRLSFDGTLQAKAEFPVDIEARGTHTLSLPVEIATAEDVAGELVVVDISGVRGLWFFAEHRDSTLSPADLTATARSVEDGFEVRVTARNLVRDLALLVDKVDPEAVVDDMLVTLLPARPRPSMCAPHGAVSPNGSLPPTCSAPPISSSLTGTNDVRGRAIRPPPQHSKALNERHICPGHRHRRHQIRNGHRRWVREHRGGDPPPAAHRTLARPQRGRHRPARERGGKRCCSRPPYLRSGHRIGRSRGPEGGFHQPTQPSPSAGFPRARDRRRCRPSTSCAPVGRYLHCRGGKLAGRNTGDGHLDEHGGVDGCWRRDLDRR